MMSRRQMLAASPFAAAALVHAKSACAAPVVGAPFPAFRVRALDDHARTERDLRGHRSLVVAMTGTGAYDEMARWLDAAESRLGRGRGNLYAFIAMRLAFIFPDGLVRSESRRRSPRYRWANMYIDRDGVFQRQLGLPDGQSVPWAFVVEADGVVSVAQQARVGHPSIGAVWARMAAVETPSR